MKKRIFIPTLKRENHAIGCIYPNVYSFGTEFTDKAPHEELVKAAYINDLSDIEKARKGIVPCCISYSAELIAEDDFIGDRLEWLKEHAIVKRGRYDFVLTNTDGGIFLDMIKDGNIGTDDSLRHKAIAYVEDMDDDDLNDMVVRSHTGTTHQWMQVFPDGTVSETEEADNNTTHWIDYPDKEVESIYNICSTGCGCNCDTCTMYEHFEDLDKEDFIESYSEENWDYCNTTSLEDAILEIERDNGGLTGEDIREQMIEAIKGIEYGYFEDEEEVALFLERVKEEVERIGKGYKCCFWYRDENCHYINGDNNFCFSVEGDKVHPFTVGGSRFAYPSDFTREEFLAKLKDICLSADEINTAYRKIAGALGQKS